MLVVTNPWDRRAGHERFFHAVLCTGRPHVRQIPFQIVEAHIFHRANADYRMGGCDGPAKMRAGEIDFLVFWEGLLLGPVVTGVEARTLFVSGQPFLDIDCVAGFGHFAIGHDVDPCRDLLRNHLVRRGCGLRPNVAAS